MCNMDERDFDFNVWQRKFEALLRTDKRAQRAWAVLSGSGLQTEGGTFLALACDFLGSPGYNAIGWVRSNMLDATKQAIQTANRLTRDADTLASLSAKYKDLALAL